MELDSQNELEYKGIRILHRNLRMRCDDYLNKNWRTGEITAPIFVVDGKLWMSLTPMEIQSNYLAWNTATGHVGMGGLGIGYTALRTAYEDDVDKITVFEQDDRIVDFFMAQYNHRSEVSKIQFIIGDARETFKDCTFDIVYMDIYDSLCSDDMLSDYDLFTRNNDIGEYHFWSEEKILLSGLDHEIILPDDLSFPQLKYFRMWHDVEESNMYDRMEDKDYIIKALETMGLYE